MTAINTDKEQAIILSASQIFSETGFARARIEDIAQAAGVGKGTVYEYFTSKEHLLLQCCLNICKSNEHKIGTTEDLISNNNITESLQHIIRSIILTIVGSDRKDMRLFIQLWDVTDKAPKLAAEARQAIQALYQKWEGLLLELYDAGLSAGEFKKLDDPNMFAHIITAVVDGWIWQRSFRDEITAEAVADRFCTMILPIIVK